MTDRRRRPRSSRLTRELEGAAPRDRLALLLTLADGRVEHRRAARALAPRPGSRRARDAQRRYRVARRSAVSAGPLCRPAARPRACARPVRPRTRGVRRPPTNEGGRGQDAARHQLSCTTRSAISRRRSTTSFRAVTIDQRTGDDSSRAATAAHHRRRVLALPAIMRRDSISIRRSPRAVQSTPADAIERGQRPSTISAST